MLKKYEIILTVLALLLIGSPLAFDLGALPIQSWDEARQAVNSLEMLRSGGQWLITTFDHRPDLWNTKPPLLIWLQAMSLGLLGPTEVAVRLPSLLASLGVVVLLYLAGRRVGRPGLGLLAGALLVTMPGYRGPHLARSGDYDALLCFWVLGQLLATFAYTETGRRRYLFAAAVAVGGAVLTKSVAGLLGLPSLALYLLLEQKLLTTLRRPAFWGAVAVGLAGPVSYYLLREWALPGYLAAVWDNELGGRYAHDLSYGPHPLLLHVTNLVKYQCRYWLPLLPLVGFLVVGPASASRRLGALLGLFLLEWLAVITFSETKFEWYTGPMLPALALLLALGAGAAYTRAQRWLPAWVQRAWWRPLLGGALAVGLVAIPLGRVFYWIKQERSGYQVWGEYRAYTAYVRDYRPAKTPAHILAYYDDNYFGSLHFYQQTLGARGLHLRCCGPDSLPATLASGTQVLVCLPELRARLQRRYAVRLVDQRETCTLYEVTGPAAVTELLGKL
jgi:4-amino-4-deoxy-L-arabinose transferase-like glycosyltransferase